MELGSAAWQQQTKPTALRANLTAGTCCFKKKQNAAFLASFYTKHDHFAKTGSGQTYLATGRERKHSKQEWRFLAGTPSVKLEAFIDGPLSEVFANDGEGALSHGGRVQYTSGSDLQLMADVPTRYETVFVSTVYTKQDHFTKTGLGQT